MEGFFSKREIERSNSETKMTTGAACSACGLFKKCNSPKLKVSGEGGKGILFITDAPEELDDVRKDYGYGPAGSLVRDIYESYAGKGTFYKDCWMTGSLNCYEPGHDPLHIFADNKKIDLCRPKTFRLITRLEPKVIVLMGSIPIKTFLQNRWMDGLSSGGGEDGDKDSDPIATKWRGFTIPDQDYKCWVIPTYSPKIVLRKDNQQMYSQIFSEDIGKIFDLPRKVPKYKKRLSIHVFDRDAEEIFEYLRFVRMDRPTIAFDYETNAGKPYDLDCKIHSLSISHESMFGISFLFTNKVAKVWGKILGDSGIKKVAHNAKFEHNWSKKVLGVETLGWECCTLTKAHFLDNRKGITGLKFQAYVRTGIVDYASNITHYFKTTKEQKYNRIEEVPLGELLYYGAMDSAITYEIYEQMKREAP